MSVLTDEYRSVVPCWNTPSALGVFGYENGKRTFPDLYVRVDPVDSMRVHTIKSWRRGRLSGERVLVSLPVIIGLGPEVPNPGPVDGLHPPTDGTPGRVFCTNIKP